MNAGKLRSLGNTYFPGGQVSVDVTNTFRMMGTGSRIDVSGNGGGGELSLAAGAIALDAGVVAADGGLGSNCGDAGTVDIEARTGALSFSSTIHATTPGGDCGGGEISLSGSSVTVSGEIDARGGGWVSDDAIDIDADPGDLVVTATGWLRADGLGQPDGLGAGGGGITLIAESGNVLLTGTTSAAGKSPGGAGGYLLVAAGGTASLQSRASIPSGGSGIGGTAVVDADGGVSVTGDLIATGGSSAGEGGDITITSLGDVLLRSTVDISAADGGSIDIESLGLATIDGTIRARGASGPGGESRISGCDLSVTGVLDGGSSLGGTGGFTQLYGGSVTIASTAQIVATPCSGICLTILAPTSATSISASATLSPSPYIEPTSPPSGC